VRVTLSFKPTSLSWNLFGNPNLTPNAIFTQTNPVAEDSFVVNNQMLYVFKNPTPYLYNLVGQIPVDVTAVSPIPDGCNGQQKLSFSVNVVQGPIASFGYTNTGGCLNNPIQFTDNTISNGLNLDLWQWNFGDAPSGANNSSILQSPSHAFSSGGSFTIIQHVVTLEGCYDDSVITINLSSQPVASFTAPAQSCQAQSVTFVNTSTIASGTITQWAWNFGDATPVVNASSGISQMHTYINPGTYTVTLSIVSSTGCSSVLYSQQITINPLPTVSFAPITAVVCTSTAPFTLTGGVPATVAGVGTGTYSGTGVSGGIFNPAVSGAGTFVITYTYTTAAGCVRSATQSILVTQTIVLSLQQATVYPHL
jgi:PKD repeat protein